MNCREAEKYLAAFVDGELRGWRRRYAFMKHLETCVLCQQRVEAQKQIKNLLHARVHPIMAPEKLTASIRKRLAGESEPSIF